MRNLFAVVFLLLFSSFGWAQDSARSKTVFEQLNEFDQLNDQLSALPINHQDLDELVDLSEQFIALAQPIHKRILSKINRKVAKPSEELMAIGHIASLYTRLHFSLERFTYRENEQVNIARLQMLKNYQSLYFELNKKAAFRRLVSKTHSANSQHYQWLPQVFNRVTSKAWLEKIETQKVTDPRYDALTLWANNQDMNDYRRGIMWGKIKHKPANASSSFVFGASRVFGAVTGKVRIRPGHLVNNEQVLENMYNTLQPLDIITDKAHFALTDKFIPGYFSHAAMWLGTKEQLIENGMWHEPFFAQYHDDIEAGNTILEVDRTGTHFETLEHFLNVDEMAVMRLDNELLTKDNIKQTYINAMAQIGKGYDFNFDVETLDVLVCSELVYLSYGFVPWKIQDRLGRPTIAPDNLAALMFEKDSPMSLIYYIAGDKKGRFRVKSLENIAEQMNITDWQPGVLDKSDAAVAAIDTP